jgi:tryptophan synthase alpha chain
MSTRISALFDRLRQDGKKALVAYLTAGHPHPDRTPALIEALERGGADLIELGVPFSDPIADGPVIQRAGYRAIEAGTTLRRVLQIGAQVRERSEIPLLLFTYLNPVMRYGFDKLASDAKAAGIDGCLLTDASVEEAESYVRIMRQAGLDTVFLAAPTSTAHRLELVAKYSSGFVYLVSRTGVTGERSTLSDSIGPLVAAMRQHTTLPLAVGFGISTPEHVAEVGRDADGVVVGSAIVSLIERNRDNPSLEIQLESFVRELKHGFQLAARRA